MLMWGEEPTPIERAITYTNRTDAEITVDLAATLTDTTPRGEESPGPLPEGIAFDALTLDTRSLTIAAGASAVATMVVDPVKVPAGTQLSGALVGSIDGEAVARTALGTIAESERYDLTITATDFNGDPTTQYAILWDSANEIMEPIVVEGTTVLRLLKGKYAVMSNMEIARTPDTIANVLAGNPGLVLDKNASVELDARQAKQITLDVGVDGLDEGFQRVDFTADGMHGGMVMPVWTDEMWATPMKPVDADFAFGTRWRLIEPILKLTAGKHRLDTIPQIGSTLLDGAIKARAANVGAGSAEEFAAARVSGKVAVVTRSMDVSPSQQAANAATSGASMLVIVNGADGEMSTWVGADDGTQVGIPVAAISGVEGRALLADMAKKGVTLSAVGVSYSDVVYDIARFSDGEIPGNLSYAPKNLARIDTTYHGQHADMGEWRADFVPGVGYSSGFPMRALRGTVREEWVNTDQPVRWNQGVMVLAPGWEMRDALRSYQPRQRTQAEYFGGIVRPYVGLGYWVPYRTSDYAQVNVPSWADGGDAMHTGSFDTWLESATVHQQTQVYLDGELIKDVARQGANVHDLPDGEQDWRVVSTATHDGSHLDGSTRTVSEWTFRSAGKLGDWDYRLLPMIQAFYDVEVDVDNLVGQGRKKGTSILLGLELGHVAGTAPAGAITEATLEARTAGGEWKPVRLKGAKTDAPTGPVEGNGDIFVESRALVSAYAAQLPVSDKGGWVDLRVTAKDAEGNTFSQEIEKAFQATPAKGSGGGHGGGGGRFPC